MANIYVLGAVKPNVKQAANDAGNLFGITTILGVGARDGASDHPKGLALDFMCPNDSSKGDRVAQYFLTNAGKYGVHYIIWKQKIYNVTERASEGWRAMPDRGGVTANHFDHVHVSFNNVAVNNDASGNITIPGTPVGIPNPLGGAESLVKLFQFVGDPHNWLRVAEFSAGGMLLVIGLVLMVPKSLKLSPEQAAQIARFIK